jgi:hypothetical protein
MHRATYFHGATYLTESPIPPAAGQIQTLGAIRHNPDHYCVPLDRAGVAQ